MKGFTNVKNRVKSINFFSSPSLSLYLWKSLLVKWDIFRSLKDVKFVGLICIYKGDTNLQGSPSRESWDGRLTRSKVPNGGSLSESCKPASFFWCGNVPGRFPPTAPWITLLFSPDSISSPSLSSKWLGSEPQNLYLLFEKK